MHLVGLTIEIYYDARTYEFHISPVCLQGVYKHKFTFDWSIITLAVTFCCCLFPHNNYSTSGGTCNCVLQLPYILAQFLLCLVIFPLTIGDMTSMTWLPGFSKTQRLLLLFLLLPLALAHWALACRTMSFHFFLSATNSLHLLTPST